MLATPLRMNLNAVHRLRLVSVHVNRFFSRDRSKPHRRLEVLNELLTLHNSINVYLQMWRNDLRPLLCAWSTKLVMRGGCEWELGYSMTYVPMYIALIFPLPRGHNCRPFGSSTTAGPPREQSPMPKLWVFCRRGWDQTNSTLTRNTHISERISDSHGSLDPSIMIIFRWFIKPIWIVNGL